MTDTLATVQETAITRTQPDYGAGTLALAQMPQAEFEQRLAQLQAGQERLAIIHRTLMTPEIDYGMIPGVKKPSLFKPGAEKLCQFYGLREEFIPRVEYGDGEKAPHITIITECRLHLGSLDGPVVNTGHGAASSWETKYRYRRGERACPSCGTIGTVIKGKAEFGGGWICFAKKGGCGAKFAENAPEIREQVVGDIENPDPFELLNTLVKMANKRSYVDASLRATATSGLYTQDVEDIRPPDTGTNAEAPAEGQRDGGRPTPGKQPPRPPVATKNDGIRAEMEQAGNAMVAAWKAQGLGDSRALTAYGKRVLGRSPAPATLPAERTADMLAVTADLEARPAAVEAARSAYALAGGDPDAEDGAVMLRDMAPVVGFEPISLAECTTADLEKFAAACPEPETPSDDPFQDE